ncbi:uncharacterized protein LOC129724643 [Wyeomyia smithii]|uniref:uncharacterized protein LOC129724643 n=1 Tax=Wyeomyia smithii TaxID=174621 RepID=UPI002467CD13|nr:uncharacterized protein LOC129724643 [Wyeomyia smithii]
MGIRHLDTFIRRDLPDGLLQINIENEIRSYYEASNTPNPPAPVIVIDLMSLYYPVCELDFPGLLCGGRYNQVAFTLECFFSRLKSTGAELVFFRDGPVQETKINTWLERQDRKYVDSIKIIDTIRRNPNLQSLIARQRLIAITDYPYSRIAKQFGPLHIAMSKECDQEVAAYATAVNAIAVVSNDTDFMIFEGNWRLWSSKDINFETFNTFEYNRTALVEALQLSYKQMAVFATLGGNDLVQYEEVKAFHHKLGSNDRKFYNLADFVRNLTSAEHDQKWLESCLGQVFRRPSGDVRERFQKSLEFYDQSYRKNANESESTTVDELKQLAMTKETVYQVLSGRPLKLVINMLDLRRSCNGAKFPEMAQRVMMRQVGILLYHQQRSCQNWVVLIKENHDANFASRQFQIEYPIDAPPPIIELLSDDPKVQASLQETKMRLLCWVASDKLSYQMLQQIPEQYVVTVITLHCLVENQAIKLFEADLLLFVAFMVYTKSYDFHTLPYPSVLIAGAVSVAFLFTAMYKIIRIATKSIGLSFEDAADGPHFDGVLFQQLYANWRRGKGNLESIKDWRIYTRSTR